MARKLSFSIQEASSAKRLNIRSPCYYGTNWALSWRMIIPNGPETFSAWPTESLVVKL